MGRCYRMKITRKMQVHVFHGNDLRIAPSSSTTLHTKVWPQRSFTDTNHCVFTNTVQTITKPNSSCCLAFACRCWVDRSDQNQFTIFAALDRVNERLAHLCLIVAVGKQVFGANTNLCANILNQCFRSATCYFDIRLITHFYLPLWRHGRGIQLHVPPSYLKKQSKSDICACVCGSK